MQPEEIGIRMRGVAGLDAAAASRMIRQLAAAGAVSGALLRELGLNGRQCAQFQQADPRYLAATLRWLEQAGCRMLTYGEAGYPERLSNIDDAPLWLLVQGNPQALLQPQIAMVGSRQFSHYGERWAQYFAGELTHCGFTVTSGLAIGIDGICHRAALAAEGCTVAVLGCGLANVYPRRHRRLAEQIVEQGGAVISDHLVTDLPLADHFPRRNRIISGLSLGVLVIEASLRSGTLITARYALEQGREVFALPGPLGSPMSEGTHWLIQQGAYLVTGPKDIAEQLGSGLNWLPLDENTTICASEAEVELPFADVLANVGDEVTPVDVVAERAGQPVPEVVIKLLDLELAGWIAAVPGGYVRIRRAGHVRRTHVLV
ncbi:DNA-protecting protein DprA [Serratia entomophila]|uniref:DNA-protecting protein DprA n=1 Tax=Serratia entomophila TaxID=42906 RepID=UPI00217B2B17|nr:DNA-protecting protein DprA [Serratia entomophila]CAI1182548.1 DNA protecting protein DprA [Serratia entomophila]CAI1924713.1 DNA protecting protein DprA [Serratia entomophila]CAI1940199.1 DNA protecting protein DprA [Serratia entomophila]CAI1983637.1 DNA protecting protein DprA [Serratia entomophila]CAI2003118.1 DNA protecting protein DprA [Serratia entomophila]